MKIYILYEKFKVEFYGKLILAETLLKNFPEIEIIKLANEVNRATYFAPLQLLFFDLVKKIKRDPIIGNKIKEDKIGKSIMI